jgi:hypothetical protein
MINPPKLETIKLPTKEDLFNNGEHSWGFIANIILSPGRLLRGIKTYAHPLAVATF